MPRLHKSAPRTTGGRDQASALAAHLIEAYDRAGLSIFIMRRRDGDFLTTEIPNENREAEAYRLTIEASRTEGTWPRVRHRLIALGRVHARDFIERGGRP